MSSSAAGLCSPLPCALRPARGIHCTASSGGKGKGGKRREGEVLGSRKIHCTKMRSAAFKNLFIMLYISTYAHSILLSH